MKLYHTVNKPAGFTFNYLSDTKKFVAVHPVIYKMNHLGNNQHRVFERLKYWPVSCSFTYTAIIEIDHYSKQIITTATLLKRIKIEMAFNIKEGKGYSVVEEKIKFKTAWPVKIIMQKIFKRQHNLLFKNIESIIE